MKQQIKIQNQIKLFKQNQSNFIYFNSLLVFFPYAQYPSYPSYSAPSYQPSYAASYQEPSYAPPSYSPPSYSPPSYESMDSYATNDHQSYSANNNNQQYDLSQYSSIDEGSAEYAPQY